MKKMKTMCMKPIKSALLLICLFCGSIQAQELVLKGGQSVELKITGVPQKDQAQFNGAYAISDSGKVRLQYLGEVNTAGMKPSQLAVHIERRYKDAKIYSNPTINVIRGQQIDDIPFVSILGEVKLPGMHNFQTGSKVMDLIAKSGGFSDFADRKRVKLTRKGKVRELDLRKANSKDDVILEPGDKVIVSQKTLF